jgi:hypothetical protein
MARPRLVIVEAAYGSFRKPLGDWHSQAYDRGLADLTIARAGSLGGRDWSP